MADPEANLDDLAQVCADLKVDISAQGVDQRINPKAVSFLKEMLSQAIDHFKNETALPLPILQQFKAINLVGTLTAHCAIKKPGAIPGQARYNNH